MKKTTKRERFLDWIQDDDTSKVPVNIGLHHFTLAASMLGKKPGDLIWDEVIGVAEATGTHMVGCIGYPMPFDAIGYTDDIKINKEIKSLGDGVSQTQTCIDTPDGKMIEILETSPVNGSAHREFLVKDESCLNAFASFIRKTTNVVTTNPSIKENLKKEMLKTKQQIKGAFPTMLWIFCPAVELLSSYYMDQQTAIFTLMDNKELMEELMDCHWKMTKTWLELGEELDVDIYSYAINGLEWLSMDLYERYMIPQAKKINDFARNYNKLSWLHTCGKKQKLIEEDVYKRMGIQILESFSAPPTGDITDLCESRHRIGKDIITRGALNVELFSNDTIKELRDRTEYVLDSTKDFKHIMADTNPSISYPWESIKTVIDVVKNRGMLLE